MSGKLVDAIWELQLSRSEREVLQAMAGHANDDGTRVWPSVGLLVWKTDLSETQVHRVLRSLRARGLLVPVQYAQGGRGHATQYRIDLSAAPRKAPFTGPVKGATITAPIDGD